MKSWVGPFAIKGGLPFVLVEHNFRCYMNLCLQAAAPFAQINAFYSYYGLKLIFVYSQVWPQKETIEAQEKIRYTQMS